MPRQTVVRLVWIVTPAFRRSRLGCPKGAAEWWCEWSGGDSGEWAGRGGGSAPAERLMAVGSSRPRCVRGIRRSAFVATGAMASARVALPCRQPIISADEWPAGTRGDRGRFVPRGPRADMRDAARQNGCDVAGRPVVCRCVSRRNGCVFRIPCEVRRPGNEPCSWSGGRMDCRGSGCPVRSWMLQLVAGAGCRASGGVTAGGCAVSAGLAVPGMADGGGLSGDGGRRVCPLRAPRLVGAVAFVAAGMVPAWSRTGVVSELTQEKYRPPQ